jgi:hypothetical protein
VLNELPLKDIDKTDICSGCAARCKEKNAREKRKQGWKKESSKIIAILNTFSLVMFHFTQLQE